MTIGSLNYMESCIDCEPGGSNRAPNLLVVGSGRCGTHSVAAYLAALGFETQHEPHMYVTLPMAHRAAHPNTYKWSNKDIGKVLDQHTWANAVVDHKWVELAQVAKETWPHVGIVHVVREEEATIRSMIHQDWYRPMDDFAVPAVYMWYEDPDHFRFDANYAGHRTRPDMTGEMSADHWRAMSQQARCRWWYRHAVTSADQIADFTLDIDNPDLASFCEFLGVEEPDFGMPHEHASVQ